MRAWRAGLLALLLAPALGPAAELLVEDFEGASGHLGPWSVAVNDNGLGSTLEPSPFVPAAGGCPASPGHSGRIHGHLGPNRAPYSWAQLTLPVSADGKGRDLSAYKSLRFWVRGDGKRHGVKLLRASVVDHDNFRYNLPTTGDWRELALPLDAFVQAGWGKAVPQGYGDVTAIMFEAGEFDSGYDFQVDQVRLSSEPAELKPEPYDTQGWFPYQGFRVERRRGTALDASGRLDAPAGKHGWLKAQGEDYAFAKTGKPVRFFGLNLVAGCNFPTHAQADHMAEALAQMGVNITRHHHIDAPWGTHNVFGKGPSTRHLDAASMDRFDYLVAQLQKRGIYQYFDLLVHRQAMATDGIHEPTDVVNGWKIEGEFDPHLIQLQEEFTRQLLGHKNPYTGKAYGQDPGVAMLELINEDSLYYRQEGKGDFAISTPYYQGVYQGLFNAWLLKRYKTRAALDLAWAPQTVEQQGLQDDEDPAKGTVKMLAGWGGDAVKALSAKRGQDAWAFDGQLMRDYHDRMARVVRSTGYRGLIAGSNHWVGHPADLALNARQGYLDRHAYWGHPNGGWDYSPAVSFDPSAMIKDASSGVVGELAGRRVKGLPYIATEWGSTAPNDYRADGPLLMGVACLLQDWSAIEFSYSHTDEADFDTFKGTLHNFFDVMYQPVWMALWPAVATMVQRGDLQPLGPEGGAWTSFSPDQLADPLYPGQGTGEAAWAVRTGVSFEPAKGPSPAKALALASRDGWVTSASGEVRQNAERGLFLVAAPRVAVVAGFLGAAGPLSSGALALTAKNAYAVIVALSLDNAPLAQSKRLLLTAGGNAVNSGMAKQWGGGRMASAGTEPVLVEPVSAEVRLSVDGPRRVWALDGDGQRASQVPTDYAAGTLSFKLGPQAKTLSYEVTEEVPSK